MPATREQIPKLPITSVWFGYKLEVWIVFSSALINLLERLTELRELCLPVFLKGVTKVTDGQRWRDTWGEVWAGPQHRTFRHCCWVCSPCQSMAVFSSMFEENKTANLKKINPHLCSLDYLQIPKIWRQPKWPLIVASQQQKVVSNCDFMDCSTLGSSFLHHLPEFAQTHVHWVSDTIQPSHPLLPASPPAFNFSQHQGLFQSVGSSHEVAKVLELQLQHQSFPWIFRIGFL